MSNETRKVRVGDIVVDLYGQLSMLTALDVNRGINVYDQGISLRPKVGVTVFLEFHRHVTTVGELLKLAEAQGLDLVTKPELPDDQLSSVQKLQRDNANLMKRLEALE